jgi:hypothetical protein
MGAIEFLAAPQQRLILADQQSTTSLRCDRDRDMPTGQLS